MKKNSCHRIYFSIIFCVILGYTVLTSCHKAIKKKRIFYVNSYHKGYTPSDQLFNGIYQSIDTNLIGLKYAYLDAKRLDSAEIREKANEIAQLIKEYKPDVLIISDDNAMQSIVMEFFADAKLPIVFCGINWSHSRYKFSRKSVTGMIEILPVAECIKYVRSSRPEIKVITVLSEASIAEEKNKQHMIPMLESMGLTVRYNMVKTFGQWKNEFIEAQENSDMVFLPTQGSVAGWKESEAVTHVKKHIRKPTFTCDDFMVKYACFGLTKVAQEQGKWAGKAALKIVNGTSPQEIPITNNRETNCFINTELSELVGLHFSDSLKNNCNLTLPK